MKKIIFLFLGAVCAVLFLAACTKKIKDATTAAPTPPLPPAASTDTPKESVKSTTGTYVVFSIRRSPCFGKCKVYEFQVLSDGTAHYSGKNNVDKMGEFVANYAAADFRALKEKAEAIQYVKFAERYPLDRKNEIVDLPYTFTSYNDGKIERKVANNYDCPDSLIEFEQLLDTFVDKLSWSEIKK
jgi:Domain of unknown function (DUF6438)